MIFVVMSTVLITLLNVMIPARGIPRQGILEKNGGAGREHSEMLPILIEERFILS